MVLYSYAPFEKATELSEPHLDAYLHQSAPGNADARRCALWVLEELAAHASRSIAFPIALAPLGRPYFVGEGAPDFNLSHTEGLAAAILGDSRVGIDVQVESESLDVERLAARFFGENEKALVRGAPRALFFELWTKKEALGKCLGVGLSPLLGTDTEPLAAKHRLSFVTERIFLGGKTYTLTACASEPIQKI